MDLKIFAKTCEQEVYDQLHQLMSVDVFKDAKVRIMPDTHAGKGRSCDIEDLNSFMKIANGYMDAVVKVRESFNMLDELAVALKRSVSDERNA